jgi:HEAT repeat protein
VDFVPVSAPEPTVSAPTTEDADAEPPALLDHFELNELGVVTPTPPTAAPALAARTTRAASPDDAPESLIEQLRAARNIESLLPPLNALVTIIRTAVAARKISEAALIVAEMIGAERASPVDGARRSFTMALRSITDSAFISALAAELPRSREQRARYMTIFARCGDEAVDVLLDQLAYAELAKDRRVLFNVIAELGLGVPTLIRMLSDDRWYVVRNAAELLGRISAMAAEEPLAKVLRHKEARVRRSAALALAKLGTPGAITALRDAIGDPKPEVRLHAILAVADRREPGIVAAVVRALDAEKDMEVQAAILAVLGKIGTPVAVRRLIAAAADDGKLFRRRPTPMRVAAVRALAEAQTPEAVAAIQSLTNDRDKEVRDSAAKGLAARNSDGTKAEEW